MERSHIENRPNVIGGKQLSMFFGQFIHGNAAGMLANSISPTMAAPEQG